MAVVEVWAGMALMCPHGNIFVVVDPERMVVRGDHSCSHSVFGWRKVHAVRTELLPPAKFWDEDVMGCWIVGDPG